MIGPDEYHEDVDDTAFTNVMARWNIARGLETMDLLRERWPNHATALREKRALGDDELADWRDAIARIVTGVDPATGIYEQFAAYHKLEPLDLSLYADRKMPIDVVIGHERTQRSQVVKQANVWRCFLSCRTSSRARRRKQFPLLRATLCPWQLVERGYPRAGRGTARRN